MRVKVARGDPEGWAEYNARRREAHRLTALSGKLDEPPRYEVGNSRTVQGEASSEPIHLRSRQWAVTAYGLECRDGTYAIPAERVWEEDWIEHMADKEWVDLADFAEGLRIARRRNAMPEAT